ncbi:proline-rich transmembrane protein 1-like [Clytia hemisphaerica]|uniref:Uncharacterized protein n=1 Tax=Clytia hemisphaerica TaxID=252671 RepID=A0A7M5X2W4_9CNID
MDNNGGQAPPQDPTAYQYNNPTPQQGYNGQPNTVTAQPTPLYTQIADNQATQDPNMVSQPPQHQTFQQQPSPQPQPQPAPNPQQPYYPPQQQPQQQLLGYGYQQPPTPAQPAFISQQPMAHQQQVVSPEGVVLNMPKNGTPLQQQPIGQAGVAVQPPPNHLVCSWLACALCFWPIGLAAVWHSYKVDTAVGQGNYIEAELNSKRAKQFSTVAIVIGIIGIILIAIQLQA